MLLFNYLEEINTTQRKQPMKDMTDTNTQPQEDKSIARNVSMFADQWGEVDRVNELYDFRNVSLALRHIINEYRQMKAVAIKAESY
jgi:hypothetical protein